MTNRAASGQGSGSWDFQEILRFCLLCEQLCVPALLQVSITCRGGIWQGSKELSRAESALRQVAGARGSRARGWLCPSGQGDSF